MLLSLQEAIDLTINSLNTYGTCPQTRKSHREANHGTSMNELQTPVTAKRRKASVSPTQRTIALLKKQGYQHIAVVEHWNPHARIRQDLFGFIDILAIQPAAGLLAVQACVGGDVNKRREKIRRDRLEVARVWLSVPGNRIEIWGWRQLQVERGSKKKKWHPIIIPVELADLIDPSIE
jgi:hypothetical protein